MAPSNTAARGIGGDTIHSSTGLWGGLKKLSTDRLSARRTPQMIDRWRSVRALVLDEVGLCAPDLFGAASFRAGLLRGEPNKYTMKGSAFGGIHLVLLTGDFLQLNPMVTLGRARTRLSLLEAPPKHFPPEFHDGARCFKDILTSVVELKTTHRFKDELSKKDCKILPALFTYMRDPKGKSIPDYLWKELNHCVVKTSESERDRRLDRVRTQNGYEMAIAWEAVGRLMQYRVIRDARIAKEMLIYIQAVDKVSGALSDVEWDKLLSEVSLSKTKNRMTFLGVFKGMRVRLMAKVSVQHLLMQDAVGTVVGIEFHDDEFKDFRDDWRRNSEHEAWVRGYAYLKYMPKSIHVLFDGCTVDVGFGVGVVVLEPTSATWDFLTHDVTEAGRKPRMINVDRLQFAVAPEKIRTAQSGQGMGMGALTAMLDKNHGQDLDQWWFHVYVILSRARHIGHLLLYGLPPKSLFERGPPTWLIDCLKEFEPRLLETGERSASLLRDFDSFRVYERASSTGDAAGGTVSQEASLPEEVQRRNGKRHSTHLMSEPEVSSARAAGVPPSPACSDLPFVRLPCVDVPSVGIEGVPPCTAGDAPRTRKKQCRLHASEKASDSPTVVWNPSTKVASPSLPSQNASDSLFTDTGSLGCTRIVGMEADAECTSGVSVPERLDEGRSSVRTRRKWPRILSSSQINLYSTKTAKSRPTHGESNIICLRRRYDLWQLVCGSPGITGGKKLFHISTQGSIAGIGNDGNSCFLIAVLQLFLRVEPLHLLLRKHQYACRRRPSDCTVCALSQQSSALRCGKGMLRPCPVVCLARRGGFGDDFRRRQFDSPLGGPQCDSCEFLEAMLGAIVDATPHNAARVHKNYVAEHGVRTILQDAVFGFLTRYRSCCTNASCLAVSDSLHNDHLVLKLTFPGNDCTIKLRDMWEYHFGEQLAVPGCAHCGKDVVRQRFLEGEPPLLIIKLERGVQIRQSGLNVEKKIQTAVEFPEDLDVMRTGKYALCGVVMHHGPRVDEGHYTVYCRMAEIGSTPLARQCAYCFFDCLSTSRPVMCSWDDFSKQDVQERVSLLLYARVTEENSVGVAASHKTPYERGQESRELLEGI